MNKIYHIKVNKEYAAALIDDLIKVNAVEDMEPEMIGLSQWQKDALEKELKEIEESSNYAIPWDNVKSRFKQPE